MSVCVCFSLSSLPLTFYKAFPSATMSRLILSYLILSYHILITFVLHSIHLTVRIRHLHSLLFSSMLCSALICAELSSLTSFSETISSHPIIILLRHSLFMSIPQPSLPFSFTFIFTVTVDQLRILFLDYTLPFPSLLSSPYLTYIFFSLIFSANILNYSRLLKDKIECSSN